MKKLPKFRKVISIFTSLFFIITLFSSFSIRVYATENEKMFDVIEITDFHGALNDSSGNQVAGFWQIE